MNVSQCEQVLQTQYDSNPGQLDNISQLTNLARSKDKLSCMDQMGGIAHIKQFLTDKQSYTAYQGSKPTTTTTVQTTTTTATTSRRTSTRNTIGSQSNYFFRGLGVIVGSIIIFHLLKKGLRFLYDVVNARRIVYLKITLPRNDSKQDRDQEKEIAKDMKEMIGRMAQVFHNMHKLGQLSTKDTFMNTFFFKPKATLIYHYEDGILYFIMGIYPEYQKIVEGSISAQYSDCSIEIIDTPNFFKKKYRDIMPLVCKKPSVYNIKIFKQQPDDPINNLVDAIGKISRYDTASIVIPIKPVGDWFNKKAQRRAEGLYRNDKKYVDGENIILRILKAINPFRLIKFLISGPAGPNNTEDKYKEGGKDFVRMVKAKEDYLNSMGEQASLPFFEAGIMITTSSDDKKTLDNNLDMLVSAFNIYGDEYGNELDDLNTQHDVLGFIYKPFWKLAILRKMTHWFFKKATFGVNELASIFHLPDNAYNRSPIISWMQYKVLPAPENIPILNQPNGYFISGRVAESYKGGKVNDILQEYTSHRAVGEKPGSTPEKKDMGYKLYKDGILLGVNVYRNNFSPVYIKREDRTRHHYCIGKSGTGKSVLLQTMARQDIWNGDGICLIDPHGDLAEDILAYIPKDRAKDLVYFDAGNEDRPMGLNLYEINTIDEADKVVNDATEIFLKMFGPEIFGPRLQEYFKYGSLTLLEDFEDKPTLLDVVRLFTDEGYREYKVKKVTNPVVKNRWEKTFNAMGQREKEEIIPYFSAKFVSFNTNRIMRNIIGQTKSAFNFDDIMNNRKILVINLSKGRIGELNAELLGMVLVSKIYNGAMARAKIPQEERKDFYLYVDEFQNFVSGTFADILSEARKYRLSLIMAHQYIAQLEGGGGNNIGQEKGGKADVKAAVFGNVGTMQSFKVGAPDAEFLEKEYTPLLAAGDIVGIANFKAYLKLNIDNATSRPFSVTSIYTQDYQNAKIVPILKEYSSKKYGRKREFVDAEINARLGVNETTQTNLPDPNAVPPASTTPVAESTPIVQPTSTAPAEIVTTPDTTATV
ncbi:MAG: hypothetical protein NTX91_03980 [candidate division SR1 bacterium]|nr:hypothetical protein [candidate division SR1 bacterium]